MSSAAKILVSQVPLRPDGGSRNIFWSPGYSSDIGHRSFLLEIGLGFSSWVMQFCVRWYASVTMLAEAMVLIQHKPGERGLALTAALFFSWHGFLLWGFVNILKLARSLNFSLCGVYIVMLVNLCSLDMAWVVLRFQGSHCSSLWRLSNINAVKYCGRYYFYVKCFEVSKSPSSSALQ